MVAVCPADLLTVVHGWDLLVWLSFGLTFHALFRLIYKHTNRDEYEAVATITRNLPGEQLYHLITLSMLIAGCYANWRVYTCENWDGNGVGHGLFFFWVIAITSSILGWIRYDLSILGAAIWLIVSILSVVNIIFAWPHDFYSVTIHFLLTGVSIVITFLHFWVYTKRASIRTQVVEWEQTVQKNREAAVNNSVEQVSSAPQEVSTINTEPAAINENGDGISTGISQRRPRESSDTFSMVTN